MNIRLLHNTSHTALTERVKPKVCAINDAVGNIFRYQNKLYVVTCKHVADDFFSRNDQYIILRGNSRIYSDKLKYLASTNNLIDIALIEILDSNQTIDFFEEDDLEIVNDLSKDDFENSVFLFLVFPNNYFLIKMGSNTFLG